MEIQLEKVSNKRGMVHRSNRCTVPLVSQWGKQDKKEK